ncbi:MAG: hypothetical protein V1729_02675 [Candidatus Woesearchaeota archaeon]
MLPIFKNRKNNGFEQRFATFSEQLAQAFAQIKTDIGEVNNRMDSNQKELERVAQWVDYLNRSNQRVSEANARLLQKHEKITENHLKLHSSHNELRSAHSDTTRLAVKLEKRHEELSKTVSAHGEGLKSQVHSELRQHKEAAESELNRLKSWIDYFSTYIERQKRKEGDIKEDLQQASKEWSQTYSQLRELLNGLNDENKELRSSISELQDEISSSKESIENSHDSAKNHINSTKSELSEQISKLKLLTEHTSQEVEMVRKKMAEVREVPKVSVQTPQQQQPQVQEIPQVIPPVMVQSASQPAPQFMSSPSSFQRHIMSRVMPNRRGYVLKFIVDLIGDNQRSTKEIEEIVVNEKQLCGRTSFYAYLKELKLKGRIAYAEIDDRTILVSTDPQQRLHTSQGPQQ